MDKLHIQDPSSLTTAQLQREILALEKLFTQRMDGIEKAVTVAHENLVRVPTDVQEAIGHLDELMRGRLDAMAERFNVVIEKFTGVANQFKERDVRVEQTTKATETAVNAALQAAKEAVSEQNKSSALAIGKSETSTGKQIEQIASLIQTSNKAMDDKINDIKERLALASGTGAGLKQGWAILVAAIGAVVGLVGLLAYVAK